MMMPLIAMVDANIQREELLPSEKAFAYKMKMDAMRRTAGRPTKENSRQNVGNYETADLIGKDNGESWTTGSKIYSPDGINTRTS